MTGALGRLRSGRLASLNALSNAGVLGLNAAFTVLLLSYILRVMTKEEYGVWELTGAVFAYAGFLQLGLNSAINYRIPRHLVDGDPDAIDAVMSTTVAFYLVGSLVVAAATALLVWQLPVLFRIPEAHLAAGRWVMGMVGGYFAFMLPMAAFQGLLTGTQAVLPMNAVRLASLTARTLLVVILIGAGHGLIGLGIAHLVTRTLEMAAMPVLARRAVPGLRVRPSAVSGRVFREMLGYGINTFLWGASSTLMARGSLLVVGIFLTTRHATELGVVLTVVATVAAVSDALAAVVRPTATSLAAGGEDDRVRALSARGSVLVASALLPLLALLVGFGPGVLQVWLGSEYRGLAPVLAVMVAAQFVFETQRVGTYVTIGLGRHRALGLLSILTAGLGVAVAAILVGTTDWGLWGVVAGQAGAVTVLSLAILPGYVGRVLGTGAWRGQIQPLVRPLAAGSPLLALALGVGTRYQPSTLWELAILGLLLAGVGWGSAWVLGFDADLRLEAGQFRRWIRDSVRARWSAGVL